MSALAHAPERDPLERALAIFQLRAEARAILAAHRMMDFHAAVDGLQDAAETSGLVAEIGIDAVQKIMNQAFAPWAGYFCR